MSSDTPDGESLIILFIISCLLVSLISKELNIKFGTYFLNLGIPYTPLLILFGLFIGYQKFLGMITTSVSTIMYINPHAILTIFLPILIFESSFNARLPSLSTNFIQVLTLIIPGVIICFLLIAVTLKSIIKYSDLDLDWWHALTLGAILSATDPVAVVALLKELGAPVHINTIIEMESLFNDGTAMVFYTIFLEFTVGQSMTVGESIVLFLRLALGGVGLGILAGLLVIFLLQFLNRGKTLFLHIVILSSYVVFYVGENLCQVSGLLAIVALGLTLNKFMKDIMTNEQVHLVEETVSYIQFLNESLLFYFAGVIIGFEIGNEFVYNIIASDWGYLIVLFIFIIIIRFIAILMCYPILRCTGEGFTFKELILSVWGGLRGALAIALALSIYTNFEVDSGRAKTLILFHTCGIAALTLLVNGTTAKNLVEEIKIIQNVGVRKGFKALFLKQIKNVGQKRLKELRQNPVFSMTLWKGVENIVQFNQIDDERKYIKIYDSYLINTIKQRMKDQHAQHRYSMLRHMMKFLVDHQHDAYFYSGIYRVIEEALLQCCEMPQKIIVIWQRCQRSFRTYGFLTKLIGQKLPIIGSVVELFFYQALDDRLMILDILKSVLEQTVKLEIKYSEHIDDEYKILEELSEELGQVDDELELLKRNYPEQLQKLSQQSGALRILRKQSQYLDNKIGSLIAEKEGSEIRLQLFEKFKQISSPLMPFKLLSGKDLIMNAAFQGILDISTIQQQSPEIYQINQEIISKHDTSMCIVVSGQVEEILIHEAQEKQLLYGPGCIVGLANLIDRNLQIQINSKSERVEIIKVNLDLNFSTKFREFCYMRTLPEFLKLYCPYPSIQQMQTSELLKIVHQTEIYLDVESIQAPMGAFIFQGQFSKSQVQDQIYGQFQFIPPGNIILQSSTPENGIAIFRCHLIESKTFRRRSSVAKGQISNLNKIMPVDNNDESKLEDVNNTIDQHQFVE